MTGPYPSSAASGPSAAASMITEKDALDRYLAEWSPGQPTSFLEAAVRDARTAVGASPPALWLGTLAYLIAVEQLGKTICLRRAPHGPASRDKASFLAACNDFGDSAHTEPDHRRLYDVRCALAHKYGLTGNNTQFVYTRSDTAPLLDATTTPGKTRVNLVAVWKYVDDMVAGIRVLHAAGDIAILTGLTEQQVAELSFDIGP